MVAHNNLHLHVKDVFFYSNRLLAATLMAERRRRHKEVGQTEVHSLTHSPSLIENELFVVSGPQLDWAGADLNDAFSSLVYHAIDHAAKLPASKHNCKFADRNREPSKYQGAQSPLYALCAGRRAGCP